MKKIIKLLLVALLLVGTFSFEKVNVEAKDNVTLFVERMYKVALGRNPDASGKATYEKGLRSGTMTAAQFASNVLLSKEMYNKNLSEAEFIEVCYKSLFDRNSDAGGKGYWLKYAQSHKREAVVKGFVEGNEFANLCRKYGMTQGTFSADTKTYGVSVNLYDKSLGNTFNCDTGLIEFFKRNYQKVLGREAETAGLNYWVNRVKTGQEHIGSAASNGFLHSNEFLGTTSKGAYNTTANRYKSNNEFIKVLYRAYLGREAETAGFNYWLKRLKSGELTRDQVINGFINSKEFSNIIREYQNKSCGVSKPTPTPTPTPTSTSKTGSILSVGTASSNYETSRDKKEKFIIYAFNNLLNRKPTSEELDYYCNYCSPKWTSRRVISAIVYSKDFKNKKYSDGEYLDVLAKFCLRRNLTAEEKYQLECIILSKERDVFSLEHFLNSVEFENLSKEFGVSQGYILDWIKWNYCTYKLEVPTQKDVFKSDKGIQEWVNKCFTMILERKPNTNEQKYWVDAIRSGKHNMKSIIVELFHSKEYITKYTSNEKYVRTCLQFCYNYDAEDISDDTIDFQIGYNLIFMEVGKSWQNACRDRVLNLAINTDSFYEHYGEFKNK